MSIIISFILLYCILLGLLLPAGYWPSCFLLPPPLTTISKQTERSGQLLPRKDSDTLHSIVLSMPFFPACLYKWCYHTSVQKLRSWHNYNNYTCVLYIIYLQVYKNFWQKLFYMAYMYGISECSNKTVTHQPCIIIHSLYSCNTLVITTNEITSRVRHGQCDKKYGDCVLSTHFLIGWTFPQEGF